MIDFIAIARKCRASVPDVIKTIYRNHLLQQRRRKFAQLPVDQVFGAIYRDRLWQSGADGPFDSGSGSEETFGRRYSSVVGAKARELSWGKALDVGCGDFRVGRLIAPQFAHYCGVDVVPELIAHHKSHYATPAITFECLNAISCALPPADVILIRQVLQHLSNEQILRVLENTRHVQHIIVTESLPVVPTSAPNTDKPHGPDTRLVDGSGVYIEKAPFSCNAEVLLEVPYSGAEFLRTSLITNVIE